MSFRHGVYKYEVPTSLVPPVHTEAGLPVIVGTAPIHLGSDPEALGNVNKPQLIHGYDEAVKLFGFSKDWEKYTLCEFIYSQFALFAVSPCVLYFCNVRLSLLYANLRFSASFLVKNTTSLRLQRDRRASCRERV